MADRLAHVEGQLVAAAAGARAHAAGEGQAAAGDVERRRASCGGHSLRASRSDGGSQKITSRWGLGGSESPEEGGPVDPLLWLWAAPRNAGHEPQDRDGRVRVRAAIDRLPRYGQPRDTRSKTEADLSYYLPA